MEEEIPRIRLRVSIAKIRSPDPMGNIASFINMSCVLPCFLFLLGGTSFIFSVLQPDFSFCKSPEFGVYPCLNNGSCEDEERGFICHCLPGFSGVQIVDWLYKINM